MEDGSFATNARIIGIPILKFQIPIFRCILRTAVKWGVGSWELGVGRWKFCHECTDLINDF
jgi:hypothetical protein